MVVALSETQRYFPHCFDCRDEVENAKDVELEKEVRYREGTTVYICPQCGEEYTLRHYDAYNVTRRGDN